jgi:hypothetical protein
MGKLLSPVQSNDGWKRDTGRAGAKLDRAPAQMHAFG